MTAPLTASQLADDVHKANDVVPFPFTTGQPDSARFSYVAGVANPWKLSPGALRMYRMNGTTKQYVCAIMPWFELTSEDRTRVNADVAFISAFVAVLHRDGHWTIETRWGGQVAANAWVWQGEFGQYNPHIAPKFGWNSTTGSVRFGDSKPDNQAPGGTGFVRAHGWSKDWPGGMFWPSTNPNTDNAPANRAVCDDVAGLLWGMEVQAVGPDAARAKFVLLTGIDHQYEGMPTTGLAPGDREGTQGRARRVGTTPMWVTGHTLSDAQLAQFPPTIVPGWQGGTVTPPVTPPPVTPPPADIKHRVRYGIEVDGVQEWSAMRDV